FGGQYRIVDFTLSNCINSGLRKIRVLTQFKSHSLDRHIRLGWNFLSAELGESVEVLPPQQRIDETWYKGTADAIYQNIYSLERDDAEQILILAGDHIYKMDCAHMTRARRERGADVTIGCIPVPLAEVKHFGIMQATADDRVRSFLEKPKAADPMPGEPRHALGSMGIYVFNTRLLFELLCEDAARAESDHDFGRTIIPYMIYAGQEAVAHRFRDENRKAIPYWRADVDLVAFGRVLTLYDGAGPIRPLQPQSPPPKFVFSADGPPGQARRGEALDSIVCPGCIVSGGQVRRSILSTKVRVNSYA